MAKPKLCEVFKGQMKVKTTFWTGRRREKLYKRNMECDNMECNNYSTI